jgi:hypothetical protein
MIGPKHKSLMDSSVSTHVYEYRYPVVPEFADMTLSLGHVLEKAPHFSAGVSQQPGDGTGG